MQQTVQKILDFMKVLEQVCLVKRDTLLSDGSAETDSAHIFKLSFFVMLVFPYLQKKYDYTRLLELALVHDIVEAVAGDCPRSAQVANPNLQVEKKQKEREAIESYKKILPEPLNNRIFDLFMEYEDKKSAEAKLVSALDKLEANFQANRYNNGDIRYWKDCENGEEYYKIATSKKSVVADLDEDIISVLENEAINLTLENMQKCQIKSCS